MPFAFFTRLFTDPLKRALQNGALIIDVGTPREYDGGHIPEALNIPLERIVSGSDGLQQARRPLILCCSTGQRSRQALRLLRKRGIASVHNGGNWMRLLERMRRY